MHEQIERVLAPAAQPGTTGGFRAPHRLRSREGKAPRVGTSDYALQIVYSLASHFSTNDIERIKRHAPPG
jgi:hypothetical protein